MIIKRIAAVVLCAAMFATMMCSCAQNPDSQEGDLNDVSNNTGTITATNPILWSDVPDPDVIRVGDTYYMTSTTMYFTPGVPIMKSTDLVTWELIGYVYDELESNPKTDLYGESNSYAQGSWASSIRYYDGMFYVMFCALDQGKSYIFKTEDIENPEWIRYDFNRIFHDASLFFDDDGTPYVIYGGGDVWITELEKDCSKVKEGGVDQLLLNSGIAEGLSGAEGSHFYKIDGTYYLMMISYATNVPGVARCQLCFRCDELLGEYEGKVVLCDSMDYYGNGVAQGGIVETPDGDWYALLFQDHGAVGRIPVLQPVTWEDGWPIVGVDGEAVSEIEVKSDKTECTESTLMYSDEFDYTENELDLHWQWNHNPDNDNWSVTDREGWFRITTSRTDADIFHARNSLTQRTEGPYCTTEVLLDTSGLNPGDYAGISAFQSFAGMVGAYVGDDGQKYVYFAHQTRGQEQDLVRDEELNQDLVYLKIEYRFSNIDENGIITTEDQARFYYSLDGEEWVKIGKGFTMSYSLDLFTGYRTALYCYSTQEPGGHADFDYYHAVKADRSEVVTTSEDE